MGYVCLLLVIFNYSAASAISCEPSLRAWNTEIIIRTVQALAKRRVAVSSEAVKRLAQPEHLTLLKEHLGFSATGAQLVKAAGRHFGNWDVTLRAAGLNPDAERRRMRWTRKTIVGIIRLLHERGLPLNPGYVKEDRDLHVVDAIADAIGRSVNGAAFVIAARRVFGGWEKALRAARLDPTKIYLECIWTKDLIVKLIKILARASVELSAGSMQTNRSDEVESLILAHVDCAATARKLYESGAYHFGGWDQALEAAGLNASKIRRKSLAIAHDPTHVVFQEHAGKDGRYRSAYFSFEDQASTPATELERAELISTMDEVFSELAGDDVLVVRTLLLAIDDEETDDFDRLAAAVSARTGLEVSVQRIKNLFARLAEDKRLINLR